jgi:hypothetical protein
MQESSCSYLSRIFCITQIVNSKIPQFNHQIFDDSQTRQWWFRFVVYCGRSVLHYELCGMTNLDTLPYLASSDGFTARIDNFVDERMNAVQ